MVKLSMRTTSGELEVGSVHSAAACKMQAGSTPQILYNKLQLRETR